MPIDPRIALQTQPIQIDDPLTVRARQAKLSDLLGQQQAQQMQLEDAQRARSDQMTLADIYRQTGGDFGQTREQLAQRGLGAQIPAFEKQHIAAQKELTETDAAKLKLARDRLTASGQVLAGLLSNPQVTHQDVIQAVVGMVQGGIVDPQQGQRMVNDLPGRPEMLRQFLMSKGMQVMDASKQIELLLPKTDIRNMGGKDQVFQTNQLTGQVTPGQQFGKTATPGEVMTDARTRSEGAANRAVTMRGQDMTNARSPAGGAPSKPMPAPAVKLQNEELSAMGTFTGLDADLAALEKQLADGKLKVGPVSNVVNRGKNYLGASTDESRNLATLRSKLENMRNAVLLLNKGVQTEGDAQRAMSEIMENLNDPGVLKQRLGEIRALNQRAVELRKSNVDLLRSNYGHEPMDFSKYESQPAAVNLGGASGGWKIEEVK